MQGKKKRSTEVRKIPYVHQISAGSSWFSAGSLLVQAKTSSNLMVANQPTAKRPQAGSKACLWASQKALPLFCPAMGIQMPTVPDLHGSLRRDLREMQPQILAWRPASSLAWQEATKANKIWGVRKGSQYYKNLCRTEIGAFMFFKITTRIRAQSCR